MKARVQYNDFKGTSAADISDSTDLKSFLSSKGVDTEKYNPIGASFYSEYSSLFTASIICEDIKHSRNLISINIENISSKEFFDLFKRLKVVFSKKDISDKTFRSMDIEQL